MGFLVSLFGLLGCFNHVSQATEVSSTNTIVLGVFDRSSNDDFESKILPILQAEIAGCSQCVVKNFSSYDKKNHVIVDKEVVLTQLKALIKESQVLFFNYNEKLNDSNKFIGESLKEIGGDKALVFSAGQPMENQPSAPLSQTLAGQVPGALIIGELGERDRLLGTSFFGPEMLTALRPPKDQIGLGLAPAIFAGRLAKFFKKRTNWSEFLHTKKSTTKKIWLDINDCFY